MLEILFHGVFCPSPLPLSHTNRMSGEEIGIRSGAGPDRIKQISDVCRKRSLRFAFSVGMKDISPNTFHRSQQKLVFIGIIIVERAEGDMR